ncbi:GLPGLI family protein [Tellurirhabdus rosea]|uniref:GLPGLI family protein n=1 Tax=Tellurirhabdus rosea TaxID=2674997 RepID=UPI002258719C|nr:GLPGLI family protein [Tellurirhabdus rosea]
MKHWLIAVGLLLGAAAHGQDKSQGLVTYQRVEYWAKIIQRLPYLSKEEKDRVTMTWGSRDEGGKTKMKLAFDPNQSVYTYLSESGQSEDGQWSWRQTDYLIQRNYAQEKKTEIHEMLGKTYIIEDSLRTPKWKILNQLKDIAGYVCMKAETFDPVKNQKITAWFANDLTIPAGPERYYGLPGLIMELDINDGDVVITALNVEFKDVKKDLTLPKLKGKKIKDADYEKLLTDHIRDSIKAQRNPYWAIQY